MRSSLLQNLSGLSRTLLMASTWVLAGGAFYAALSRGGPAWVQAWSLPLACAGAAASAWLGWAVRQAWLHPARLRKAERVWNAEGYASDVSDLLAAIHLATGELGYRVWLLRAQADLALGYRNLAWSESEEAHLARVPFWLRPFLRRYLRSIPGRSRASLRRSSGLWLRLAPRMPRLKWVLAVQLFRQDTAQDREQAWDLLLGALPDAAEDPLLLEDLMLALLGRLEQEEDAASADAASADAASADAASADAASAEALERVMRLLLHRHGVPRLGWDRVPPALWLLRHERHVEALAFAHSLPMDLHSEMLWLVRIAANRGLGELEEAWRTAEQALALHPESFRLWMMQEDLALELRRHPEALEALRKAEPLIAGRGQADGEQQREWHTRRAEYAYWVEHDAEEAARHLDHLPEGVDREGRPPLRLLILLDLGRFDEVHRAARPLLAAHPGNPELQLLQAESLAGMEAWASLQEHLEGLGDPAREHADFWHLRGICRSHLGDLFGAREDLERSARMEPEDLRMLLDAGHASAELGDWERSEHYWRQVLRQDDCNEEALTQLAEARRTLHDVDGAKRLLRECLLHHPESRIAQGMLAELDAN